MEIIQKNVMTVFAAIFMMALLFVTPMAVAQDAPVDTESVDEVEIDVELDEDAGITPDSALYGIDKALERISLALTFNRAKKARLRLRHAEERLAEVKAMIEEGKEAEASEAQADHDELIEEVETDIDEIDGDDGDDSEDSEDALEDVIGLEDKVRSHTEKVVAVKLRILERQGDRMTEEQLAHLEEVFARMFARAEEAEIRAAERRDRIRTRLKVVGELSDEELERLEARIEQRVGIFDEIRTEIRARLDDDEFRAEFRERIQEDGVGIRTRIRTRIRDDGTVEI